MRGPLPAESLGLLRKMQPMATIRGNFDDLFTRYPHQNWTIKHKDITQRAYEYDCERLSLEEQNWLGNLQMAYKFELENISIECYHASPHSLIHTAPAWAPMDELEQLKQQESTKILLYGHLHHSYIRYSGGTVYVNCGSVGAPYDGDNRASYAILDLKQGNVACQLRRVSYDLEKAIQVARQQRMPDFEAFEYALRFARYPYDKMN